MEAEDFKNQLGAITDASSSKDEEITNLSGQNADLQAQLDDINARYAEALERANNPLPAALATELTEFCARNSDVCEFDAQAVRVVRLDTGGARNPRIFRQMLPHGLLDICDVEVVKRPRRGGEPCARPYAGSVFS